MNLGGITNALRGIGGDFEINRVCGAFGTIVYVIGAVGFVAWNMIKGEKFNVTEFCLAYPGGLAVCVGAIAGAVALKDRNVAVAQTVRDTGSMPGKAAEAQTGEPAEVTVVNAKENPVPTKDQS